MRLVLYIVKHDYIPPNQNIFHKTKNLCTFPLLYQIKQHIMETPEEMKERFKELGEKEGYIDGIFNYCDRWCERCRFTSKCRNYAFDPENQNLSMEDTFKYVSNVLKATMLMIEEDAKEMGIDLSQSYLVGDAATDLLAGQRAGCQLFLVLTGRGWKPLVPSLRAVRRFTIPRNLLAAAIRIFAAEATLSDEGLVVPQAVNPSWFHADRRAIMKNTRGGQV